MLTLTPEQLEKFLAAYQGTPLNLQKVSGYHKVALEFFTDPSQVIDPRIEFTSQLDITDIYRTYLKYYHRPNETTFTAYLKWMMLKAMQNTPFNWRYINNNWYEFNNLPLEVNVITNDERGQIVNFLYNVSDSTWEKFSSEHAKLIKGQEKNALDDMEALRASPLYAIAHQIVGVHLPHITSYKTTRKIQYSHHPWIVFSDRYSENSASNSLSFLFKNNTRMFLPLHMSISHASLSPHFATAFLRKFVMLAKMSPKQYELYQSKAVAANIHLTTTAKL
jgi:chloramphenicol O-acetyltransferase